MTNPSLRTPFGEVELRPAAAGPQAPEDMRVYILLPDLDELLGVPAFGLANPIRVPKQIRAGAPSVTFLQ